MVCQMDFAKTWDGKSRLDLVYKKTPQRDLMLTFLPPIEKKYTKAPVYFLIPGGGWHVASRQSMIDFSAQSVEFLRKEGFAVVGVDYRVCKDGATMREMITDCFDGARYVAHFADALQIDKDRFVTSGHSAGGHLALMLAYAPQENFQSGYEFNDDFHVKVTAVMSPPTILHDNGMHNLRDIDDAFVGAEKGEKEKNSPISYVTRGCPPTFLSAGTSDYLVFANSSEMLYQKLCGCGVECELVLSIGGGHCFEQIHGCLKPSISMEEVQDALSRFIMKHI